MRPHTREENAFTNLGFLQPEKTPDISWRHGWFPRRMTSEKWAQKFHTDDVSLARSGQCPWLVRNLIHPIRSTTQNYPDLGSDASSVWNFCARSSDVISRGNQWLRRKTSAVFSGYGSWIFSLFIILCAHRNYNIIIIIFVIFTRRCQAKLKAFEQSMYVACSEFSCCRLIRSLPELSSAVSYLMTKE